MVQLKNFARSELNEVVGTVFNHIFDSFCPTYRSGELSDEVCFDFCRVGVGKSIYILIDGADGCFELGSFDGSGEFGARGLHAGRVEATADFQFERTASTGFEESFAGFVDGFVSARDYQLTGAVIVGACYDTINRSTDFFNLFVGQTEDCRHSRGIDFAGFLHCLSAGGNETQTVFKRKRTGGYES